MKNTIIEKFAGPYDRGEFSPSVQKTLYDTQVMVLNRLPEVNKTNNILFILIMLICFVNSSKHSS